MPPGRVTNAELKRLIEERNEKIDQMHECLFGDGNPGEGLATRILFVEKFVSNANKIVWIAVSSLVVAVTGLVISLL